MSAWIDRLFRLEEINGGGVCPTYLYRWTLLRLKPFQVYLHHFVGDDWSRDLHDHPKRFISIGLWGAYVEETPGEPLVGRWETRVDEDGVMVHVRWSVPDDQGRYLWVRHYPADGWGRNACERQAAQFNAEGRSPDSFDSSYAPAPPPVRERRYRAPWVRTFPAEHVHRLRLEDGRDCWTLVIVLRAVRMWGFWRAGRFVPWREYVRSADAKNHRSCP